MSLIDWSDPDEMLGLLIEYVADEAFVSGKDRERVTWLRELRAQLEKAAGAADPINTLREIRRSQPREFESDSVMTHIDACIEELERINATAKMSCDSK